MRSILKRGFTLIEMLVVLVIVSLTTTLLMTGLSTTWRNFERLGVRDLTMSAGQMGGSWFRQSIEGAVMYHPYRSNFTGSENSIRFVSFNAPFDKFKAPRQIEWRIATDKQAWILTVIDSSQNNQYSVNRFESEPKFEFLRATEWENSFSSERSSLPRSVRVMVDNKEWLRVSPMRPILSDMPVEYPSFGNYEF